MDNRSAAFQQLLDAYDENGQPPMSNAEHRSRSGTWSPRTFSRRSLRTPPRPESSGAKRSRSRSERERVSTRHSRSREMLPARYGPTRENRRMSRDRDSYRHSRSPRPNPDRSRSRRSRTKSSDRRTTREFMTQLSKLFSNTTKENFSNTNVVPEFDPALKNQSIHNWLTKVNECAVLYGWSERQIIHYTLPKLTGVAKKWYEGLPSVLFSWTEWQTKLRSAFPAEENYGQMLSDMLGKRARFGESLEEYFYDKVALLNRCDISGKRAVECILHGIDDRSVRFGAEAAQFNDPDKLLAYLRNVKNSTKILNMAAMTSKRYNRDAKPIASKPNQGIRCYNCKQEGHPLSKCPKPVKKCSNCQMVGHLDTECYRAKKNDASHDEKKERTVLTINANSAKINSDKYVQEVLVNGFGRTCFIDLGSELTLIRETDAKEIFDKWDCSVSYPMVGFGGSIVNSSGACVAELSIQNVVAKVKCIIVPDHLLRYPLLIGQTYTEQSHIQILKTSTNLHITSCYDTTKQGNGILQLKVAKDTNVKDSNFIDVTCDSMLEGGILVKSSYRSQPNKEYFLKEGVYQLENGTGLIAVVPLSKTPIHFKKGELIARVEVVLEAFGICEVNRIEVKGSAEPFTLDQINTGDISKDQSNRLLELVNNYRDCFATTLSELGCTGIEKMSIDLSDNQPVVYRPYRLSQKEREEVQCMIEDLSNNGIIRESSSPFASPIILVRKKTGDKRLCIDYRALNRKTVKQHYPLPCMEDQMNRLSGNRYYSTLDLASGYYQIELTEESKPKTAFVTPDGQWEFNRMPFGLANAPAVFQRTINKALGTLRFNTAVAYMDDVLVPSTTVEEGLNKLEMIFKRLREFNLTLKPSKCNFFQTSVEFLGFEITSDGIRPGKKKIEAVQAFPIPKSVHNVRQFLGLASFFRKFIKNFAAIARPLTNLLKNNTPWSWEKEQQFAFDELKNKLVSRPILALYDPNYESELHTDASKWGVGGILMQKQETGDLKPVAYFSRQTSPVEQHFSSYELETLAVVSSLIKFRPYLFGMSFTVVTDCNSLRATFLKRDMIPRVARWWSLIQEFDCDIKYKSGNGMCHVDALSRNPVSGDVSLLDKIELPTVLSISEDWLKTVQLADGEIERIKTILQDPDSKNVVDINKNYCVKNNSVYRMTESGPKWLVPRGVRWHILKACHDDIGHFSIEKTVDKIKESYWFPKLKKFAKKYVQSCLECAHSKAPAGKKSGYLHPIPKVTKPFHTLHADHLGPFNESKKKNKYLLVIIDSYSKFIVLKAVKNTKAITTIRIFKEYFATFGCPVRLITDRYSSFSGKKFKAFLKSAGVKHIMNAVATPRANGQVERYNRTILDSLTAMNYGLDEVLWDEKVPDVQWGLNNTTNKGIGKTPAEVLFGLRLTGMTEGKIRSSLDELNENEERLISLREEVNQHIVRSQAQQKERFDKSRCGARIFKIGDLVRVERSILCPGKSKKLVSKCLGPYKIIKVLSNDRYMVEDTPITRHKGKAVYRGVYPVDRIHPWLTFKRSDLSDEDSDAVSIGSESVAENECSMDECDFVDSTNNEGMRDRMETNEGQS